MKSRFNPVRVWLDLAAILNFMQSPLEQAIRDLASFLPQGKQMPMEVFSNELKQKLTEVEDLSQKQPGLRDMYRKLCFDLCAYELDGCFILRRLRYKPLGYGGDFEVLDKLYTGTGTTFWDAFLQHQESVQVFQEFEIPKASKILFLSPVYRLLQNLETKVSIVEYESQAIQFARGFTSIEFYDSLDTIDKHVELVYAPFLLHRLHPESVSEIVKYLWQKLQPEGSIVFYQLDCNHSLRWFMEWCLDWTLYYHDVKLLKKIAKNIKANITIAVEGEWARLELKKIST